MMKKWLPTAFLLLSLLAGGYVVMPVYTAQQIVQAAQEDDNERLRGYIDFAALRTNLSERLENQLRQSMGESVPEELGNLLAAGANLFIGPLLGQLVTPEGISDLLRGEKSLREFERELYRQPGYDGNAQALPHGTEPSSATDTATRWRVVDWQFIDINHIAADCGTDSEEPEVRLILQRQSAHWRLVDISLM